MINAIKLYCIHNMKSDKVYFPGLNALRMVAALLVFLAHVESLKGARGLANWADMRFFSIGGASGVNLFFCISGFLITFLLLSEKGDLGTVKMKDFYIRRILRIWPLYYLVLVLTLFIIPHFVRTPGFDLEYRVNPTGALLYVFLCPYIAKQIFRINFLAAVLWSVGVEETFYLIWPVLIRNFQKIRLSTFFIFLIVFMAIKAEITFSSFRISGLKTLSDIFDHLRLECMIIGGLFAYILKAELPVLAYLRNTWFFGLVSVLLFTYFAFGFGWFYDMLDPTYVYLIDPLIYSLLCCILIINIIYRRGIYSFLEHKVFFELGRISYGFYVYHSICIMATFLILDWLGIKTLLPWLTIVLSFILTVTVSFISFYAFEQRFLSLKKKFTHVISGQEAKGM